MKRGELYRVRQPGGDTKNYRVFVIVGRQALVDSKFSTVICAPVFSNGQGLATQVQIGTEEGLKHLSWIMCDNLLSVRKSDLSNFLGSLSHSKLIEIDRALRVALDLS